MAVGFVYHPDYLLHDTGPHHPERAARLEWITQHLQRVGLRDVLHQLAPAPATVEQVALVHPLQCIEAIRSHTAQAGYSHLDPDTVACPRSFDIALLAVGGVLTAIDAVLAGTVPSAFCAVRPPGHHATATVPMGFCLFNNVAIGARYAQQRGLRRILIVDWDVHHGNGTQAIFEEDPDVFYCSSHQYPYYPSTGARDDVGSGAGQHATLNLPMPAGSGDADVLAAYREELLPRALAFRPELVLISAGFDGHRDDPLAGWRLTEAGYAELTRLVRQIADASAGGRIVSVLEGGYHPRALPRSVEAHLRALGAGA